jgi:hypothetical protein
MILYCKFGEADAYIYDDLLQGITCYMCSLQPTKEVLTGLFARGPYNINNDFLALYDYNKMIAHITEHRLSGGYIPKDVDRRLIEDRNNATDK